MDTFIKYNMTVCLLDLVYNLTNVVPGGQFCYGHSMDTNEAIVLACDTCLRGHCVQVTEIINILENNKNLCLNLFLSIKIVKDLLSSWPDLHAGHQLGASEMRI